MTEPCQRPKRIGLALSGGGFRAAIFHLGVIRRLEELEMMKDVDVVSTVSGGSIIGAYYLCEMERHLRDLPRHEQSLPSKRVEIFEKIAKDFLDALDCNIRTRALIFTPFYHPWSFVKTLALRAFRASARSELIQLEYDTWFYDGNDLDQLPAVTKEKTADANVRGPKLVMNTTSLLTGERVSFSREPVSGMAELSKVNKNVLPLSKVVGASSGVPVLFPPTCIAGNLLVDGGVADNQGIEALMTHPDCCDVMLISDASGQMEQLDSMKTDGLSVYGRVNTVLQHVVRARTIQHLIDGMTMDKIHFAFVHLFMNLKDRGIDHRVSSAFIPEIGRIRTDLDQFSFIEREALMYHGYTLIDAQLKEHCKDFLAERNVPDVPLRESPLFHEEVLRSKQNREIIRRDLKAGKESLYLLRAVKEHGFPIASLIVLTILVELVLLIATFERFPTLLPFCELRVQEFIGGLIPAWLSAWPDALIFTPLQVPGVSTIVKDISGMTAVLALVFLYGYVLFFFTYTIVRRITLHMDRRQYRRLTGGDWTPEWPETKQEPEEKVSSAAGSGT